MTVSTQNYQRVGLTTALLFATLGLFSAFLLLALIGGAKIPLELPIQIFVGVAALYVTAACFGNLAGYLIYRRQGKGASVWLVGIGLAWFCLLMSCIAGSSVELLKTSRQPQDFINYIFKPVFWVMFFGTIPASLLGIAYTATVKKRLVKDVSQKFSDPAD